MPKQMVDEQVVQTPPVPPKKGGKKKKAPPVEREVLYKEISARICAGPNAIRADKAKELLGWEENPTDGSEIAELKALFGIPIALRNNGRNRWITGEWVKTLAQEHLNRRWQLNGETIVIGKTGLVLSAQHRLLSLIYAKKVWEGEDKDHWKELWPAEPRMETVIIYGVDESDTVFRTMNTGKPASFAECLYRCERFAELPAGKRKMTARILDHTIRQLWNRTGANRRPFAPRRTHSEAEDFIQRHPRVVEAAAHMVGEIEIIKEYISPGYAAALFYLMAVSESDGEAYRLTPNPTEKKLKFNRWDKAVEFFVKLGVKGDRSFSPLREAIAALKDPDSLTGGTVAERICIFAKAWNLYVSGKRLTVDALELEYDEDDHGNKILINQELFGGIDFGNVREAEEESPDSDEAEEKNPPQEKKGRGKKMNTDNEPDEDEKKAIKKRAQEIKEGIIKGQKLKAEKAMKERANDIKKKRKEELEDDADKPFDEEDDTVDNDEEVVEPEYEDGDDE